MVHGETCLVDTGFMEGEAVEPPLRSPSPYPIKTAEVSGEAATSLQAKSLQGVIVRFDNVTIEKVFPPDRRGLRRFSFHDESGGRLEGLMLETVTIPLGAGQKVRSMRAILHQPRLAHYEAIVELDKHLTVSE